VLKIEKGKINQNKIENRKKNGKELSSLLALLTRLY